MKRILILNYEFPPLGGGGGVATYKLAKGFMQLGYHVDYITSGTEELKKYENVDGIHIYRVKVFGRKDMATASMLSMFTYVFFGFFKGIQLCRKNKYDFINTQFVLPTGPLGFLLSKIFRRKNILSLVGGDIYDPTKKSSPHAHWYFQKLNTFLMNKADRLTAISQNTKENTITYYHPKKNINVIPLPYEIVSFDNTSKRNIGLKEEKKYIIGVGRLVKRKGFDFFIQVIAKLPDTVCGIIIGDGPEEKHLKELAKELKIEDRIVFTGFVDQNKKFQYLQNSDIFFLSSVHEGFGIVLQEAMQVGLPIVATNNGGQIDLVKEGENGFLVEFEDTKKAQEKISTILKNETLLDKEKIKRTVLEFELSQIANHYIDLIK